MIRTTKELLQLTLNKGNQAFENGDQDHPYGYLGLCGLFLTLYNNRIITANEHMILYDFLNNHIPRITENLHGYYWPRGDWKPRKKWLKYYINITNENN